MALHLGNNVQETSTTTGTGNFTLAGAVANFLSFTSQLAIGDSFYYGIQDSANLEVGIGTIVSTGPTVIGRTTVLYSTNGGALVNWGAGTKNVYICLPASTLERLVTLPRAGSSIIPAPITIGATNTLIHSATLTTKGGDVKISGRVAGTMAPGAFMNGRIHVLRDTTQILDLPLVGDTAGFDCPVSCIDPIPSAGSHTYYFYGINGGSTVTVYAATLTVEELP